MKALDMWNTNGLKLSAFNDSSLFALGICLCTPIVVEDGDLALVPRGMTPAVQDAKYTAQG
jgi:hypothetical protein